MAHPGLNDALLMEMMKERIASFLYGRLTIEELLGETKNENGEGTEDDGGAAVQFCMFCSEETEANVCEKCEPKLEWLNEKIDSVPEFKAEFQQLENKMYQDIESYLELYSPYNEEVEEGRGVVSNYLSKAYNKRVEQVKDNAYNRLYKKYNEAKKIVSLSQLIIPEYTMMQEYCLQSIWGEEYLERKRKLKKPLLFLRAGVIVLGIVVTTIYYLLVF